MASKRLAGTCFVKVGGQQIRIKGGLEAPLNDKKREPVMDSAGVAGYKESPIAPVVKVTALVTQLDKDKLANDDDLSIQAEFADGTIYTLGGAWLSNEASVKGDEGEVELEFTGMRGNWQ
ncbi:phage tail tube protein [Chitinibacter fontanus]|uniref:Phage tail tube protein n=1 Tax=Chitinibacter fontanus TaxID=1737446 RepID=A0A7D5ZHV8_9NEIS|nr:phage tail tube protein [Chitinibacter fontanus]QLI80790.1 phage tail tube protein [Chitinibacter fontanus]